MASEFGVGNWNWELGLGIGSWEFEMVYWHINGWRQAVHYFPRTKFYFWGFNKPGVEEYGLEIEKKWNRVYGRTSTHTFSGGFYVQPKYDSLRAINIGYDPNGKLSVGYVDWSSSVGAVDLNLNAASTLGGYSTWNFNRLTALSTFSSKKVYGIQTFHRFIAGKIWSKDYTKAWDGTAYACLFIHI